MNNLARLETAEPNELADDELPQAIALVNQNLYTCRQDILTFKMMYGSSAEGSPSLEQTYWNLIAEEQEVNAHLKGLMREFTWRTALKETRELVNECDPYGEVVVMLEDYRQGCV